MKILDWYILKRFLSTFFFVVLLLIAIIVVIDITEKNDDFIKSGLPWSKILKEYYLNFIPYIANMISPLMIFIATVFITARMASHTEIVAMLSSGISFPRLLVPYIIGSVMIGVLTFCLIGWVIPKANKKRVAFENQYIKNKYFYDGRDVHLKIAPNTYAYMESYNNDINAGYQFTLETIIGAELKSKLKATKITWQPDKKSWNMEHYQMRTFEGNKETWVNGSNKDTVLELNPKDFESKYLLHETFTMDELNRHINLLKERESENVQVYLTEKYERYNYPFAVIILTIIGVIVSAKKSREGAGFQIAFGFVLAFVYIIFVIMSRSFAQIGGMGPLLASWLPNIVFSFIGIVMYKTVPR